MFNILRQSRFDCHRLNIACCHLIGPELYPLSANTSCSPGDVSGYSRMYRNHLNNIWKAVHGVSSGYCRGIWGISERYLFWDVTRQSPRGFGCRRVVFVHATETRTNLTCIPVPRSSAKIKKKPIPNKRKRKQRKEAAIINAERQKSGAIQKLERNLK